MSSEAGGQFVRAVRRDSASIQLTVDGVPIDACLGDSLITALLTSSRMRAAAGVRRDSACRILPDGCLSGLLGLDRNRSAGAGVHDACRASDGRLDVAAPERTPAVTRVVIVGGGPAGIRAASVLAEAGLRPVLIDESRQVGGQGYRAPSAGLAPRHGATDGLASGEVPPSPRPLRWPPEPRRLPPRDAGLGGA